MQKLNSLQQVAPTAVDAPKLDDGQNFDEQLMNELLSNQTLLDPALVAKLQTLEKATTE